MGHSLFLNRLDEAQALSDPGDRPKWLCLPNLFRLKSDQEPLSQELFAATHCHYKSENLLCADGSNVAM